MEAKKKKFEKELKSKIQQKLKGKETEESFLTKAFKFMDITGSGKVNFDQFSGAIGRMGFALEKPDLQSLFVLYDSNNDGFIDYREFCGELFGTPESRPATAPTQKDIRADKLVDMFRKKVNERGAKGIMGLIKCFKDVDKDKSGTLSQDEFKMAMKEYKLGIDDGDLEVIFKEFDKDRDSLISQEEFLRTIRGEMNEYRKRIVNAVFDVLDTNKTGIINIGETKKKYSGAKHPAVLAGRKTDSQVVDDLATALDLYQNCYELKDGTMTREEFIEFYNNVSASIDSDTYFEEMMKNCWGLKPEQLKATAEPLTEEIKEKEAVPVVEQKEQPSPMAVPPSTVPIAPAVVEEEKYIPPPDTPARRFRDSVVSRGVRGILGLERQFKVYTKAGLLELNDLKKAVEDFRLHVDVEDLEVLFKELDKSGEGKVEYEDIIRTILGTMSENRQRYVEAAFDIIDKDKDGIVDSEDISRVFEGWKHPEVKSGKHRAEDILHDVLEVLDNCTALHRGSRTDGRYTKEEFFKYFEYISACTPLDSDFENMFCTVWKVDKNALPPIVPKAAPVQEIAEPVKEPPKVVEEEKVVKPAAPIPPVEEAASEQDDWTNTEILDYIKSTIIKGGVNTIFTFLRNLTRLGKTGNISKEDLTAVLKRMGVFLIPRNLEKLFKLFATEPDGTISTKEFSQTVVGEMNPSREETVEKVFKKLDKDNDGLIETQDMIGVFDASKYPEVLAKKKTEKQVLAQFLDLIEMFFSIMKKKGKDDKISMEEFKEFYNNISCTIEDDSYFDQMLKLSWKLDE